MDVDDVDGFATNDGSARRGPRDNGLRCGNYAAVADLDPRVADALLASLRSAGIAAYVAPMPGAVGGSMETRVPSRPLDRLYVDDQRVDEARGLVDEETATEEPATKESAPDFEASWQQVLTSLQSNPTHMTVPWPERENLTVDERAAAIDEADAAAAVDEDHFVPPPPPPLPRLRPVTYGALATMAFAVAVMVTDIGGEGLDIFAFFIFVGAAASLVYNMRQGPPDDDGWDDGAVV